MDEEEHIVRHQSPQREDLYREKGQFQAARRGEPE
jgi:hypothetical protein